MNSCTLLSLQDSEEAAEETETPLVATTEGEVPGYNEKPQGTILPEEVQQAPQPPVADPQQYPPPSSGPVANQPMMAPTGVFTQPMMG